MTKQTYPRIIEIQEKTVSYNGYNEPIYTWASIAQVWAQISTTGGGEFYAAQKLNSAVQVLFKIRYGNSVNVQNRIRYENRIFEILSINDVDESHRELLISAKEVV